MAKLDYDKIKALIEEQNKTLDIDEEIRKKRTKLGNLSREGALLIIAHENGIEIKTDTPTSTIKLIDSLKEGDDYVEIAGVIVQAYDLRYYEVCPSCAKRVSEISGVWKCVTHGVVEPAYSYVMNMLVDDGSGTIKVVLFSKQLERMLNLSSEDILQFRKFPSEFEDVKTNLLGKIVAFRGNVKMNNMRIEFVSKLVFTKPEEVTPRANTITTLMSQRDKIPHTDDDIDNEEFIV